MIKKFLLILILLFPLSASAVAKVEISNNSVRALYHLEDANDSSGNGFNMTNTNAVTFQAGQLNNAASTTGNRYLILNDVVFASTTDYAMHGWVYIPDTAETGCAFSVGTEGLTGVAEGCVGTNNGGASGNERLATTQGIAWLDTNTTYGTGWHMVDLVHRSTNRIYLYTDGSFVADFEGSTLAATNQTVIGGTYDGGLFNSWEGLIDEVAYIVGDLSTTTITALWNGGAGAEICVTAGCAVEATASSIAMQVIWWE